jgi:N-acetylglucosaminyldiphosphoundecaprenol N-acetyl-beta-D-mannosaminyltransferase
MRESLEHRLNHPQSIGDVTIQDLSLEETADLIVARAADRAGGYVCTPNADYVVQSRSNIEFRSAILGASLRVPDGMWVVYASWIAGRPLTQTVTGRLLIREVAARAVGTGMSIALFGASPGVAEEASRRLCAQWPGLRVAAAMSPPMGLVVGSAADLEATARLASTAPSVVFVGLGAPREVLWMQAHTPDFGGAVVVGIGAGIDIAAGRFRTAPRWMTRIGLEWLFRLAQEPRRLARRYLVDDPWILIWALTTRLGFRRGL